MSLCTRPHSLMLLCTLSLHSLVSFSPTLLGVEAEGQKISSSEKYKSLETFSRVLYYLEKLYVDSKKVEIPQQVENAISGIIKSLDPHTILLPKKAFEQLTSDTKGQFGGVGIVVTQDKNRLFIISPMDDSPAAKAGVKSGDEIIAIDSKPISTFEPGQAVDVMRGPPGSKLGLTIKRKNEEKLLEFVFIREVIKVSSVQSTVLSDGVYYVKISSFQENTSQELQNFLEKNSSQIKGLVLDLRDNPGGLLDQSVKVVDLFIDSGLIVSTVGRAQDRIEREFAHKTPSFLNFPLMVLINEGSASASEIVAGALQDHQRALIMGTQSFGKGSVQTLISLPDGSGLKVTVATYYTPNDRSIQAKGITPDIVVSKRFVPLANHERKTEADLEGHLRNADLSDLSQKSGILTEIKKWPESNQTDYQLITAFTYLKGWSVFSLTPPKKG